MFTNGLSIVFSNSPRLSKGFPALRTKSFRLKIMALHMMDFISVEAIVRSVVVSYIYNLYLQRC